MSLRRAILADLLSGKRLMTRIMAMNATIASVIGDLQKSLGIPLIQYRRIGHYVQPIDRRPGAESNDALRCLCSRQCRALCSIRPSSSHG